MTACLPVPRFAPLVLLAALATLAAGCLFGGDDDGTPTPTVTASPTAEATPTVGAPTPSATPSPDLPVDLEPTEGAWLETKLTAGDEVPDTLGAFLFDPVAGTGTLWSLEPGTISEPVLELVSTTPGGKYVIAANHIVNTATGQSFATTGHSGLARIDDSGRALFQARGCEFWVVDLDAEQPVPVSTFQLDLGVNCSVEAWFSPDGSRLLVVDYGNNFDGGAILYTVDLAAGEVDEVGQVAPTFVRFFGTTADGIALLSWGVQGSAWLGRFDWSDGTVTTALVETGEPRSATDKDAPEPIDVTPVTGRPVARLERDRRCRRGRRRRRHQRVAGHRDRQRRGRSSTRRRSPRGALQRHRQRRLAPGQLRHRRPVRRRLRPPPRRWHMAAAPLPHGRAHRRHPTPRARRFRSLRLRRPHRLRGGRAAGRGPRGR